MRTVCCNDNQPQPPPGVVQLRSKADYMPAFTWFDLEAVLTEVAATPAQADMCRHLVTGARKRAVDTEPQAVLREVLVFASVMMDPTFNPHPLP